MKNLPIRPTQTNVVVGMQWGDEGKGKITHFISDQYDMNIRYQGGNNAGHTIIFNQTKYILNQLPSSIFNNQVTSVLAQGMVINPKMLITEINSLKKQGVTNLNFVISDRAHIILPYHLLLDQKLEALKGQNQIGTTKKGIGPAYNDKYGRIGIRMAEFINPLLFKTALKHNLLITNKLLQALNAKTYTVDEILNEYLPYAQQLKHYVGNTGELIYQTFLDQKRILFEGAQGLMLCIENGTYPFVTSSSPSAAAIPLYTGNNTTIVQNVLGVVKSYTTRVGGGVFPTEITNKTINNHIREVGHEFGSVTKRPRRIGWLDTVIINYGKRNSNVTHLAITLLDVLDQMDQIKIGYQYYLDGKQIYSPPASAVDYERVKVKYLNLPGWKQPISSVTCWDNLPLNAQKYIQKIENLTNLPVKYISVGPSKEQTLIRKSKVKE